MFGFSALSTATPGLLAAAVFLFGSILISFLPRYKWLAATGLLILVTPLASPGFWFSTGELGISDWDYYFSYHHHVRRTILEFNQLPLWNPWTCGGTSALGDPEFPLFAPTYLLELIFGIPAGFRLAIYFSLAGTAVGVLMLAKKLYLSVFAALLAAIAFTFGSVNLLEIVEGHPNIFAVMWLPWVFWSWLSAYRYNSQHESKIPIKENFLRNLKNGNWKLIENWKLPRLSGIPPEAGKIGKSQIKSNLHQSFNIWMPITSLFLSLMFFQGGIYLLTYTTAAFLAFIFLARRHFDAFKVSLFSGLWAIGISAIKLFPVIGWLRQFQDTAYASSAFTLPYLHEIFLVRHLHRAGEIIPNQGGGWHEYGAYLGPIILLLALFGLFRLRNRIVKSLLLAAILATLLSASGPFLKPLFDQLPFIPRSNISRTILFAVIPLSLLAAFGLDFLAKTLKTGVILAIHRQRQDAGQVVPPPLRGGARGGDVSLLSGLIYFLLLFLAAIDLFTLSSAISYQPFVLPDVIPAVSPAPYPIAYTALDYKTRHGEDDFTRAYAAARAGYGTLSYCSVLTPVPAIRTIHDEGDNGIISLKNPEANYQLLRWSPNKISVAVSTPDETEVLLNTNYARGWLVNGEPADDISGRVALKKLPAGHHQLQFSYHPPGLIPGLVVSFSTILAGLLTIFSYIKRNPGRSW